MNLSGVIVNSSGTGLRRMRRWDAYALVYLLDGQGLFRDARGFEASVTAGDLILIFPRIPHQYGPRAGEYWNEIFISFLGPVFDLWHSHGLVSPDDPVWRLEPVDAWHARFVETVAGNQPQGPPSALESVVRVQMLLAEALSAREAGTKSGDWLTVAKGLLEASGERSPLPLTAVAAACGMSYESFRKKFAQACGLSPARYRQRRQIEKAKAMILHGAMPGKEIAHLLGFYDEFHFSKSFKRVVGVSPREFRRRHA